MALRTVATPEEKKEKKKKRVSFKKAVHFT